MFPQCPGNTVPSDDEDIDCIEAPRHLGSQLEEWVSQPTDGLMCCIYLLATK